MRASLIVAMCLVACAKREEARPAPETRASAPPEPLNAVEIMACRDGVFGKAALPTPSEPAPSAATSTTTVASTTATSSAPTLSSAGIIGILGSDAGSLFAPIDDSGFGVGGLGLSGIGGFGHGSGIGFGTRALRMVYPIAGAPTEAGGKTTLAIAKGACSAHGAIKQCHTDAGNPVGTLTFDLALAAGKLVSATKSGGDLSGETFEGCVSTALVAQTYDAAPDGKAAYRFTFEPGRRETAPGIKAGTASVTGSLPPEVIGRIVRAHSARARACYNTALKADPKLSGTLKLRFTIDPKGNTKDVKVADGTITDATMRSCVTSVFSAIKFPEPDGGGEVTVSYPLTFTSAS